MDENTKNGFLLIHKKHKTIWLLILSGMIGLVLAVLGLDYFRILSLIPVVDPILMDKITLLIILVLVLSIFFLKKSYLNIHKIIEKARVSKKKYNDEMFSFLSISGGNYTLIVNAINVVNSMMMLIWFLTNLIVITAFVNYIFVPLINTFIIYSVVGIYSLIINYPAMNIYKKIYAYIID